MADADEQTVALEVSDNQGIHAAEIPITELQASTPAQQSLSEDGMLLSRNTAEASAQEAIRDAPGDDSAETSNGPRPWRILSLDGGGVKGLAELLITERLMRTIGDIRRQNGHHDTALPLPCDYFDMIVGTSTGGLIAIMLGRLRMSITDAITAFKYLCPQVFPQDRDSGGLLATLKSLWGSAYFEGTTFEAAVKEFLRSKGLDPNEPLMDLDNPCKVFVCSTRAQTLESVLFRSYAYPSTADTAYECSIWEAARATSAAPLFFPPFRIARLGLTLVDGALRLNNPINEAITEAYNLEHRGYACVVSIGTGVTDISPVDGQSVKLNEIAKTCAELAINCNNVAQVFARSPYGSNLLSSGGYFRFDVDRGMDKVGLAEWTRSEDIQAYVDRYLSTAAKASEVQDCAWRLCM